MTPAFNAYAALALAIVFEVTASALLQQSAQFTRPWPTLGMVLLYVASFYALSVAIRVVPLSIAYAIWGGVGIIMTATVSLRAVPPDTGRRSLRRHWPDRIRCRGHQLVLGDHGALMPGNRRAAIGFARALPNAERTALASWA